MSKIYLLIPASNKEAAEYSDRQNNADRKAKLYPNEVVTLCHSSPFVFLLRIISFLKQESSHQKKNQRSHQTLLFLGLSLTREREGEKEERASLQSTTYPIRTTLTAAIVKNILR
jgi:hypothetical protein